MITFNFSYSQSNLVQTDQYLIGEEKKLEMIVHIWGEVKSPGEYRVPDGTNVLELISKAGGPTEFANLKAVLLTRKGTPAEQTQATASTAKPRVFKVNLQQYLVSQQYELLLKLEPGDVVILKRNSWFRWQTGIRLVSQIAFLFQAMYYFTRI
jgi:protein involved in polysaccharide export with SLBB domain